MRNLVFVTIAFFLLSACGDLDWLRVKRPKFENVNDGAKNDTIYEDVDFNDPYTPDECTDQEPAKMGKYACYLS